MNQVPQEKLDPRMIALWRWNALFGAIFGALLFIGFAWLGWVIGLPTILLILLGIIIIALILMSILYLPKLKYQRWRYEIKEVEIELQRGVWVSRRTVVPIVKIQHVDTVQGPLMRKLRLMEVIFYTAAGPLTIPGLEPDLANSIRNQVASLARVPDDES
jgi:membrane protein YdbS with pleckstrin-like domain